MADQWEFCEVLRTGTMGGKMIVASINGVDVGHQKIPFFEYLKKLGEEGWEVVSYVHFVGSGYMFKRHK